MAQIDFVSTRSWVEHRVLLGALVTSGETKYPCPRTFELGLRVGAISEVYVNDEDAKLSWWFNHLEDIQLARRELRRARWDSSWRPTHA